MPAIALKPEQVIGEFLPIVYISKITLRNNGDENLAVDLALTIKDITGAVGGSKWFPGGKQSGEALRKYIKINIVQTTTDAETQRWSALINSPSIAKINVDRLPVGSGTTGKQLGLIDFDNNQIMAQQFIEYNSGGSSFINVSKVITCQSGGEIPAPPADPRSLAYFVWSSFDFETMARDSGTPSRFWGSLPVGKMNSDIVFRNGELVSEGYVFYVASKSSDGKLTKTNTVWSGDVHYMDAVIDGVTVKQPMGGKEHNPNATDWHRQPWLIRESVPYRKVEDFRVLNRIDKLNLDFSSLENELLQAISKGSNSVIKDTKFSYFTDIFLSRDQNNNCRFFFGIDLPKMVRENSPYSNIFAVNNSQNPAWLGKALEKIRILSVKIYRKRTVGSSEVGTSPYYYSGDHHFDPVPKLRKFDDGLSRASRNLPTHRTTYDPSEEFIICAGEVKSATAGYEFKSYSEDGVSEIMLLSSGLSPSALGNVAAGSSQMLFFTGTDARMSENTDGYYQYKIEIEIQDSVVDYLIEKRSELLAARQRLQEYYSIATSTGSSRRSRNETNPHIDWVGEGEDIDVITQRNFFDPTTNRFTGAFQSSGASSPGSSLRMTDISKYINILKMFVNLTDEAQILIMLKNYIRPSTGNPQGIMAVLNLYETLISFLNRAIGLQKEKPSAPPDDDANITGQYNSNFKGVDPGTAGLSINTFKLEHTFEDYFDANLPRNTGFDFIGAGYNNPAANPKIPSLPGLRVIDFNTFENHIVAKELTKVFNSPTSRIQLRTLETKKNIFPGTSLQDTDFTFLTPAVVYPGPGLDPLAMVGDGTTAPPNINSRDFMNMTVGTVGSTTVTALVTTGSLEEKLADFLSYNYNLTAVPVPEPRIELNDPGMQPGENFSTVQNADYNKGSNAQTVENQKAFDVFWDLVSAGVVSAGGRGGVTLPEGSNQKSIDYYNAANSNGFYDDFIEPIMAALRAGAATGDPEVEIAKVVRLLPNPIKALIRYNDEQNLLSTNYTVGAGALNPEIDTFLASNPFNNAAHSSKARILFETIGQIEYLAEFGNTEYVTTQDENSVIIAEKSSRLLRWAPLDREVVRTTAASALVRPLLCRIRSWKNGVLKIGRQEGNDLPTYEEYFLLKQGNSSMTVNMRAPEPDGNVAPQPSNNADSVISGENGAGATGVMTDYIMNNWDALEIIKNANVSTAAQKISDSMTDVGGNGY